MFFWAKKDKKKIIFEDYKGEEIKNRSKPNRGVKINIADRVIKKCKEICKPHGHKTCWKKPNG